MSLRVRWFSSRNEPDLMVDKGAKDIVKVVVRLVAAFSAGWRRTTRASMEISSRTAVARISPATASPEARGKLGAARVKRTTSAFGVSFEL